jgi:hypothetical protein
MGGGVTMAATFSIDIPGDVAAAVARARAAATAGGGTFAGDTAAGTFSGATPMGMVRGAYRIAGQRAEIAITEKPTFVPMALVEGRVRSFFSGG